MPNKKHVITVNHKNKKIQITSGEIRYMKGYGNYTIINTINGECYLFSKTMKYVIDTLCFPFVRIHKSYSIHPNHFVKTIDTNRLLLSSGEELPIAKRRIAVLESSLKNAGL